MGIDASWAIRQRLPLLRPKMPCEESTSEAGTSGASSNVEKGFPASRRGSAAPQSFSPQAPIGLRERWLRPPQPASAPAPAPAAEAAKPLCELQQLSLEAENASGEGDYSGCCALEKGSAWGSPQQHISDGSGGPPGPLVEYGDSFSRCISVSKACCGTSRMSSGTSGVSCLCSSNDKVCRPQRHPLFSTAEVHGLPPKVQTFQRGPASARASPQQLEEHQQPQQPCGEAPCDAGAGGEERRAGDRCTACGTLKAKAPSGFLLVRSEASLGGPHRKPACQETLEGLGTLGGPPRQLSCEDCGCLSPCDASNRRGGRPYHLLTEHQRPVQGEVVAGGVQWGQPTSFWLVDSAKEEAVEREVRRIFRINSAESQLALSSFRLLVTVGVVLAALKYGISTCFPPANQLAFICFFVADLLTWVLFSFEATLRARTMGLNWFCRDGQCIFDTLLQLVGLAALVLRACILMNLEGLGTRVFDPNPLERTDGIVNDFTIGDVQITLVALDTIQLARIYRLAFSCRELYFLTRSILHSLRSLLWTALFVLVVIYTCAIFCTWAYYDEDDAEMRLLWGNLVLSMFTLFTVLTLEGWNNVATATAEKHPFSRIFFVAYICFTTLTLLNIVTGIILDAYVDMSSRLLKEASYKDDLEKNLHNEKVLLSAFEKTCFLVCLRPALSSTISSQRTVQTLASTDHSLEAWGSGNQPASGSSGADVLHESTIPMHLREGDPTTTWRLGTANNSLITLPAAPTSHSPPAAISAAAARFERKPTGVPSEDSTARPSTESATDSEPLQIRTHMSDSISQEGICVRTCVKYLRIGGHQPMDILRHPIVQDALQVARIPFYQAFDVLSMYHRRGIQFVTVKEFAEACGRVAGAATGRQLLQVQLELQQKLCAVEQSLRTLCRQKQLRHIPSTTSRLDS